MVAPTVFKYDLKNKVDTALSGLLLLLDIEPGALPQAIIFCPFAAS